MRIAITRDVSPSLANCELTHLSRVPIDVELARKQHLAYERCLAELGCQVHRLPASEHLPDSVFVEDVAVVCDELAIITRPGAPSRRPETALVAEALRPFRTLHFITAPATLDGGDVLSVGRSVFIGLSSRTNEAGVEQMRTFLLPYGYKVEPVRFNHCLHLKSAVTHIGTKDLLLNPAWVDKRIFDGFDIVEVTPEESMAANALLIGETVIYPTSFPQTLRRMERRKIACRLVDMSELSKAEGAVTCCSLIVSS